MDSEEKEKDSGGRVRKRRASCRGKVKPPDGSDPDPEAKKRRVSSPPEFGDARGATVLKPPDQDQENSKVRSPLLAYLIK